MDERPIGIFDSGLGGLTVVREIKKLLPGENIVYLGDTARVPYGTRSKKIVTKFALEDADFLLSKNVKCIIIACNTASALASDKLGKKIKIPLFDVIAPAAREAVKLSLKSSIGVIGTRGTINSKAYEKAVNKIKPKIKVCSYPAPLLVPLIEEGEIQGQLLKVVISKYVQPFKDKKIDTLILGCTHYPIIAKEIMSEMNKNINFINPGEIVATEVEKFLKAKKMENLSKKKGKIEYLVTDLNDRFIKVAEMFLGEKIKPNMKEVSLD